YQRFLLVVMYLMRAGSRAGRERAANITQVSLYWAAVAARADDRLHLVFDEVPRTHVLRLFLHPAQLGRFRIASQNIGESLQRERIKLFQANNRHIFSAGLFPLI